MFDLPYRDGYQNHKALPNALETNMPTVVTINWTLNMFKNITEATINLIKFLKY